MIDKKVLELVVFELREGVEEADFLGTVNSVSDWIREQPGFVSRTVVRGLDSSAWFDIVWWESVEHADAAAEAAFESAACAPMFRLIRRDSADMHHAIKLAEIGPPALSAA